MAAITFFLRPYSLELEQNQFDHYTHPCVPTVYACECLHLVLVQKVRKLQKIGITFMHGIRINIPYLVEQVEVLLDQFEWKSRDSPTETRLTDRYRSTDSLSFVTPANFPRAMTIRRTANDVTYTMYAALPIHYVYNLSLLHTHTPTHTNTHTLLARPTSQGLCDPTFQQSPPSLSPMAE